MHRFIIALCLTLPALPALAGSPNNPGAGGQFLRDEARELKESGSTVGEFLNETREADPDFTLGGHIQEFGERFLGSTPNPANDRGGGNDRD
ncbi:hypothetical protein [Paracoccus zhejiangensis]|uniref:hypothetical protein n=1 Tax=Paracoccus zhejiangensis TaxID=1077935 RepID=UPI001300054E|nr:hypothetical protein [Paracoccus zhejiangensis]